MLIDFHCHTRAVKNGESPNRTIKDAKSFCDNVNNAGVKMVAITNHNTFDLVQFNEIYEEARKSNILVFPGVELDVIGRNNEHGHAVLFCSEEQATDLDATLRKFTNGVEPNNVALTLNDFIDMANMLKNSIIMTHYYKSDALCKESIDAIVDALINPFRLFYEPSSYRTLGIMVNNNFRALKGSDLQNWNDYAKQEFANLKIDIGSYDALFKFIQKDNSVIESLLEKTRFEEITISYTKDKKRSVRIYSDVNIIFGEKASGKTTTLDEIKRYYKSQESSISFYSPQENPQKLKDKLSVSAQEKNCEIYNIPLCRKDFDVLSAWKSTKITNFMDYLDWARTQSLNKNKEKFGIVKIRDIFGDTDSKCLSETLGDLDNINSSMEYLNRIPMAKYLKVRKIREINDHLNELRTKIIEKCKADFSKQEGENLSKKFIDRIKTIVDKNTDTRSLPGTTGFLRFASQVYAIKVSATNIGQVFGITKQDNKTYIGNLGEDKNLYKITVVKTLCSECRRDDGFESINDLNKIRKLIQDIANSESYGILEKAILEYLELVEDNTYSMNNFLGVTKKFILDDGNFYTPSTGEETMIALNEALVQEADVYLLDEPEKSLGNGYVNDVIVKYINKLAREHKTVVVVTHNANIAVRTLPYQTILKVYDGEYFTYEGNLYTGKMINMINGDEKVWKEESINILEGGKEAFEERGDIYD